MIITIILYLIYGIIMLVMLPLATVSLLPIGIGSAMVYVAVHMPMLNAFLPMAQIWAGFNFLLTIEFALWSYRFAKWVAHFIRGGGAGRV